MKFVKYILVLAFIQFFTFAINNPKEKINWLTIEAMQKEYSKNPKPILIDLYTNWCGWCKVMDKSTYGNDKVAAYINENYYAIKLDAETKEAISFNGKVYNFNPTYQSNDLAMYFTFGRREFPTTVFLSYLDARPAPLSGYLKPKEIEAPLKFFGSKLDSRQ
ncbi:MAG: DUF255 domain-containing protein, partial [Ferruginibacter sp.]